MTLTHSAGKGELACHPELTVSENLILHQRMKGISLRDIGARQGFRRMTGHQHTKHIRLKTNSYNLRGAAALILELTMEQEKHKTEKHLFEKEKRFLRLPDICRKLGISKSTIYLWITQKRFPEPLKIGRMSVWLESQVDEWMLKKQTPE